MLPNRIGIFYDDICLSLWWDLNLANNSKDFSSIVERYSRALLDLSKEQNLSEKINDEIQIIKSLISKNQDLNKVLESPILSRSEQKLVVNKVLQKANASELLVNFFSVVCMNRRSSLMSKICERYIDMYNNNIGILRAEIVSSKELSDTEFVAIEQNIEKSSGSKINLISTIDHSILGGYVLKIGSLMLDGSIKSKLQGLKASIRKG